MERLGHYGTKPVGTAAGTERWVSVSRDDTDLHVTAYLGWGITDEVRLRGDTAETLLQTVVDALLAKPTEG